jgi:hypothetical protein
MRTKTLFLVAVVTGGVLLGLSLQVASQETQYGTRDRPLEGQHFETLRALARYLDATARGALEGATYEALHGTSSEARFLPLIRSFAHRAADFHAMMDNYQTLPFEVPAQVDDLTILAHQVNDQIRSDRGLGEDDDCEVILDVLERMRLLLAGGDVEVPAAHVASALSGSRLREFRQLAQDVDSSATRAHEIAKRDAGHYPHRGQQFLGELYYFAVQSRGLHGRTDAGPVNPQQIEPTVSLLLEDARQADRSMRDARVFTSVWDDSGRTITMLQRMASLVQPRHHDDEAATKQTTP